MLKIKAGVTPKNLVIAAALANAAWDLPFDVVITSGTDGTHMKGSKHYSGNALDVRTSNIPKDWLKVYIDRVKNRLGPDYDLVLEVDHLHVEYDPVSVVK